MKPTRLALAALGLSALTACGAPPPPPPPGTPVDVHPVTEAGPRIPNGVLLAATDLTTLRALIDAIDGRAAVQLGGDPTGHPCLQPLTAGHRDCWPDLATQPDTAYLILDAGPGSCVTAGTPQLGVSGTHIELQIPYSDVFNCRLNGVAALPAGSLFSFSTRGLKPGLYTVAFVLRFSSDTYRSDSTYLSIPRPAPGAQAAMEREATDALTGVVGSARAAGLFSLSRVDGSQLAGLCGRTVAGPAYLVTYESDVQATPRYMVVTLAGPTPLTCASTRI